MEKDLLRPSVAQALKLSLCGAEAESEETTGVGLSGVSLSLLPCFPRQSSSSVTFWDTEGIPALHISISPALGSLGAILGPCSLTWWSGELERLGRGVSEEREARDQRGAV